MTDLSTLSDEELTKLYQQKQTASKPPSEMTDDELKAAYQSKQPLSSGDTAADVAKSGGVGLAKGGFSLLDMFTQDPSQYAEERGGGSIIDESDRMFPKFEGTQKTIENATGTKFYEPKTTAGKYAQTIGEFAPATIGGEGNLALKFGKYALVPAVASETAGQATEGTAAEPYARIAGALLGTGGASLGESAGRKLISPISSTPERQSLVRQLEDHGVTSLTAGQKTGSETLQRLENKFNSIPSGMQASKIAEEGDKQLTNAVMQRAGSEGSATPENLQSAQDKLGSVFNDLSSNNTLKVDPKFSEDLNNVTNEAKLVLSPDKEKVFLKNVDDILGKTSKDGTLNGTSYQAMRSRYSRMARNAMKSNDSDFAEAMKGLRSTLDDAMGRSIKPEDKELWNKTRSQYANLKTIEKAVTPTGEAQVEGLITPQKLATAVKSGNPSAAARGQLPMSDLARASQVMQPVKTPLLETGHLTDPLLALPNAAIGRTLMSKPVQSWLSNQRAKGLPIGNAKTAAIINALMASQHHRVQ